MQKNSTRLSLLAAALCAAGFALPAAADEEVQALKQQVQAMMQRIAELEARPAAAAPAEKKADAAAGTMKVYGQLRLSMDSYSDDFGAGTAGAGGKGTTVKSNSSRFGFKGELPTSIDGTNMIYLAEVLYGAADNTASEIQWREGFAGLKGGWGQARLGRIDVPYKTTLTTIDPWNDNAPQSRGFGGKQGSSSLHSSYFTNAVEYVSPSFNGVKIGGFYSSQLDDETSSIHDASPLTNYKGGEAKGLGVKFNQGGLFVGADWIDINADTLAASMTNGSGWQLAAGYKMGDWSVAALYEDVKDLGIGTNLYLNGTYKIGKTTLIATVGQNRDAATYSNRDIDTWSIGAKYALTKDSELFGAWVDRSEDAYGTTAAKDYQILSVGINAKFGY
jgi:predicted porin